MVFTALYRFEKSCERQKVWFQRAVEPTESFRWASWCARNFSESG